MRGALAPRDLRGGRRLKVGRGRARRCPSVPSVPLTQTSQTATPFLSPTFLPGSRTSCSALAKAVSLVSASVSRNSSSSSFGTRLSWARTAPPAIICSTPHRRAACRRDDSVRVSSAAAPSHDLGVPPPNHASAVDGRSITPNVAVTSLLTVDRQRISREPALDLPGSQTTAPLHRPERGLRAVTEAGPDVDQVVLDRLHRPRHQAEDRPPPWRKALRALTRPYVQGAETGPAPVRLRAGGSR